MIIRLCDWVFTGQGELPMDIFDVLNCESVSRRSFLGKVAAAGLGAAAFGATAVARANPLTLPLKIVVVGDPEVDGVPISTAAAWSKAIFPTVHLSKHACEIAKSKTQNSKVLEFVVFEYNETVTVSKIEAASGNPVPPPTAKSMGLISKLNSSLGHDFDTAFMMAQRDAHEHLIHVTNAYLSNATSSSDPNETGGLHLAMLSLDFFMEHHSLAQDILAGLG
jgi:hypothetical protein